MRQKKHCHLWVMRHKTFPFFIPHSGCPHQCSFCEQRAISGQEKPITPQEAADELVRAKVQGLLTAEMEVAFFGGSFTAIGENKVRAYLEKVFPFVQNGDCAGIRVSTRPDAVEEPMLLLLKRYGVKTIELGAQSMRDDVLIKNGRGHTVNDVRQAAKRIRAMGFSLGLQMMVGLYGDTHPKDTMVTAQELCALSPDFVRIYPTVIVRGTTLAALYESGEYVPMTLDEGVNVCADLLELFEAHEIPVIRLGLQDSLTLVKNQIGGLYHPAFRELCESVLYRRRIEEVLRGRPHGHYTVFVHPSCVSKAIGHGRCNCAVFEKNGFFLRIKPDEQVPRNCILVERSEKFAVKKSGNTRI